ncbi:MarR family winged helix-turn-helix transcriptional regulator [Rhodococcus sp. NPDC059234]|uniref:MarR family winged helix-turn-helix transcriptional regulator n=1 Tax=Rhodococcus sp. NPDC059234 TaxID=3346781 RepID=UPI00366EEE8D
MSSVSAHDGAADDRREPEPDGVTTRPQPPFDLRTRVATYLGDANPEVAVLHLTLLQIGRMVEAPARTLLAGDGLEMSERWVLVALLFTEPPHALSPKDLSTLVVQTTSGMSKTLRRLERGGFVLSEPDPADGRSKRVKLTDAGEQLARKHLVTSTDYWQRRLAHLPSDQVAALADAAWTLLALVDPSFEPGPPPARGDR